MNVPTLPPDVIYIINTLNEKGFEAYIVGGCVRDTLLLTSPKDWDITTSATPQEAKALFDRTFDTGIQHGTITVVLHKVNYEVTTYRIDGDYKDCRHPVDVLFTQILEKDLARRDFTMNAIAYHPQLGYQDPFQGQADIQNRLIRGVGNPGCRFQEDGLRMLRCLRFAAQLGFDVEEETYHALCANIHLIQKISAERIRIELEKLWLSPHTNKIPLLWESGLLAKISEELSAQLSAGTDSILAQLALAPETAAFRWALVLQDFSPSQARKLLNKLKFDNETAFRVLLLLENSSCPLPQESYAMRVLAGKLGIAATYELIAYYAILYPDSSWRESQLLMDSIEKAGDCLTLKYLAVKGSHLMALGVPKGKGIGNILKYLLDEVHKDPKKNTEEILTLLIRRHL